MPSLRIAKPTQAARRTNDFTTPPSRSSQTTSAESIDRMSHSGGSPSRHDGKLSRAECAPPANTRAEFRCLTHPGSFEPEISETLFRNPLHPHHLNPTVAKFVTAGFSHAPTKRQRRFRRNIASLRNKLRHVPRPRSTGSSTQRDTVLPPLAPDLAPRTPKLSVSDQRQPARVMTWFGPL